MANLKFDPSDPIAASKQQWRTHLKIMREKIPEKRQVEGSINACRKLRKMCENAHFILSFASFGSEVNLWPLNQELCNQGRLVLPLVTQEKKLLLFRVTDFNQLEPHRWGMLEPKNSLSTSPYNSPCPLIDFSNIDIALIPGLGFDPVMKYRLGYGLGCYDKLLGTVSLTQTWGIGLLEQAVNNLPYSHYDIPLNEIFLF